MFKRNVHTQDAPVSSEHVHNIKSTPTKIIAPPLTPAQKELKKSFGVRIWLATYNLMNTIGWLFIIGWIGYHWVFEGTFSLKYAFEDTKMLTVFLLAISTLEILHNFIGWVGTTDMNIFIPSYVKVFNRVFLYFAALWFIPETQRHVATGAMLFLWAWCDLLRYPFYALNTFEITPYGLTYFRYSNFVLLYPIAFTAEVIVWFLMLPYIAERELHSISFVSAIFPALRFWYFYASILYLAYQFITFSVDYRRMLRDRYNKLFGEPLELRPQLKTDKLQQQYYDSTQDHPLVKNPRDVSEGSN